MRSNSVLLNYMVGSSPYPVCYFMRNIKRQIRCKIKDGISEERKKFKENRQERKLMVVVPVDLPAHHDHPNVEYGIDKLESKGGFPAIAYEVVRG